MFKTVTSSTKYLILGVQIPQTLLRRTIEVPVRDYSNINYVILSEEIHSLPCSTCVLVVQNPLGYDIFFKGSC